MSMEPASPDLANKTAQPDAALGGDDSLYYRRVLRHVVEIGDYFAELIHVEARQHVHCQAEAAKRYPDPDMAPAPSLPPDIVDAYERITRSVRRSIMLADRLAHPRKTASAQRLIAARKKIIRDVEDAIHSNAPPGEKDRLHREFLERLDSPHLEYEIADRRVPDIVKDICRDLGVAAPDGAQRWKRRMPHDIALLCARAEQISIPRAPRTAGSDSPPARPP